MGVIREGGLEGRDILGKMAIVLIMVIPMAIK